MKDGYGKEVHNEVVRTIMEIMEQRKCWLCDFRAVELWGKTKCHNGGSNKCDVEDMEGCYGYEERTKKARLRAIEDTTKVTMWRGLKNLLHRTHFHFGITF